MIHVVLEGQKWSCKIAFRLDCLSKYMESMPRWKAQKNKTKPTMKVRRLSMNVKVKAKARKRPQRWNIPHQKALLTSSSREFPISDFSAFLSDDFNDLSWVCKKIKTQAFSEYINLMPVGVSLFLGKSVSKNSKS